MAEIAEWGGVRFMVEPEFVRGMRDLKISMQLETEDKTSGGEKFVAKKNAGGYEISMTAVLDGRLGIEDVQSEALALAEAARVGKTAYFYMAGKKLVTPSLMMTGAEINNIRVSGTGAWIGCEAALTLKQAEKYGGGSDGGGSGGGGGNRGSGGGGGNKSSGGGGNKGGTKPTGIAGKPTGPTVSTDVGPKPGPRPRITPY